MIRGLVLATSLALVACTPPAAPCLCQGRVRAVDDRLVLTAPPDRYWRGAYLYVLAPEPLTPGSEARPRIGLIQVTEPRSGFASWYCKPPGPLPAKLMTEGLLVEEYASDTLLRVGKCWGHHRPEREADWKNADVITLHLDLGEGGDQVKPREDQFEILGDPITDWDHHAITGFERIGLCTVVRSDQDGPLNSTCQLDRHEWPKFRLLPTGWADAGVFRQGEAEILVPFDSTFADYAEALDRAARQIARFEGRALPEVVADLGMPRADRVRFAQTGEGTADGMIGVDTAPSLFDGARKTLLSAAHGEERPNLRFHKRMTRATPEALLRACRMGPAEQQSFAFSVLCPHDVPDELPGLGFGRRTVNRLMRSVSRATRALVSVGPEAVVDAAEPLITANLCEALVQMMPRDERADLQIDARFSPVLAVPADVPAEVRIERSLYRAVEDLSRALRPTSSPTFDVHVGRVVELKGDVNDEGRLEGEVVLRLEADEELIRARCWLGPDDYMKALDAHGRQRPVSVHGRLTRGARIYALEEPSGLNVIE